MTDDMNVTPEAPEYGAPPKTTQTVRDELTEPAQMSPFARVGNIFFSPGEVFQDVRRSPRDWWLPMLLTILIASVSWYTIQARYGWTPEQLAKEAIEAQLKKQGKNRKDLTEQERGGFEMGEKIATVQLRFVPVMILIGVLISGFVIAGFFRLATMIVGAQTTLFRLLSVVAYSQFVPGFVKSILNIVLSFLRSAEDVNPTDFMQNQGLISTGPAALVSAQEQPVLHALLGAFDVFSIWVLVLMIIGLVAVSKKLKYGTAGALVIGPYIVIVLISMVFAAMF
jgi:hypothetical protein